MTWLTAAEQLARNIHIMELWAMGHGREHIAKLVDLTPQRVSQIVNSFGYGWREEERPTDRNHQRPAEAGNTDGGA